MSGSDEEGEVTCALGDGVDWPVSLRGVTETVVTTLGPNGRWNAAALGVFAETVDDSRKGTQPDGQQKQISARTWGNTRTRRNFHRQGEGYVQFTRDPVDFVDAALSVYELEEPILESADAWVRVSVEQIDSGSDNGTQWEDWQLRVLEATVESETVPTIDRGFGAVIEATVAASRLDISGYDETVLRDRLDHCASVVERAGSGRERKALSRIREHTDW